MKGKLWLGIFMVFFLGLAACSQAPNTPGDKEPVVADEENNQDKEDNNQYGNEAFKEVTLTEKDDKLVLKGKARVFEGVFQYAVMDGTEVLLENHYQTDGAPAWGNFEISIDKELAEKEGVFIELFVYSAKDGSKTDILTIPIK